MSLPQYSISFWVEGQVITMVSKAPVPFGPHSLFDFISYHFLQLLRLLLPQSLCTYCPLCLECSSPISHMVWSFITFNFYQKLFSQEEFFLPLYWKSQPLPPYSPSFLLLHNAYPFLTYNFIYLLYLFVSHQENPSSIGQIYCYCITNLIVNLKIYIQGGRWEGGSGWGTHLHPWWIHVSVWQNQYNTVK